MRRPEHSITAMSGAKWLVGSDRLLAKAFRFACIGLLGGSIYALVTIALVSGLGIAPVPASLGGYVASVPLGFIGHRQFSFRSNGRWTAEVTRFVVSQALNMSVTAGAMYAATRYFAADYGWGMVAAVILVPIANFALLNLWVFRDQGARGEG
jgi:putative flippase GtrA